MKKTLEELIEDYLLNGSVEKTLCVHVPANTVLLNRNGTSKRSPQCPNCGPWIDHWHKFSNENVPSAGCCAIKGCTGRTKDGHLARIEGCHVTIKGHTDQRVFIAPICQCCNHEPDGAEMVLARPMTLVWSNVQDTCDQHKWDA